MFDLLLGINILFTWMHDTPNEVLGYHLWKGKTVDDLAIVSTVDGGHNMSVVYDMTDDSAQFGLSAFNEFGDSKIITTRDSGEPLKLGKPVTPAGFSYSVK